MFPIHNLSGKVIGFGGRKLTTQDNAPKYINTPESELYQKSKILYGISQARKAIRAEDHCLLVEGYTDVVSMHQGGVENVVASSGTALTVDQIKLIKKFTENIIILYDGDSAGVKAALRGLDMVLEAGMNLKMVLLPDNEDPDSYIRKEGAEKFKSFVEHNASDFILFKSKLILEEVKNDPVKKSELIGEIIESISKIPDPIRRSLYIKECSALLKVQEQLVINEVQKKKRKEFYDKQKLNTNEKEIIEQVVHREAVEEVFQTDATSPMYACEREICRLLLEKGGDVIADSEHHLVHYVFENLEDTVLKHPLYQVLYQHVKSLYKENTVLDLKYYLHHENEEIRKAAEEVTTYQYDLANWNNRDKDVQLPKWNENYSRDIIQAVARYKILLVTEMIEQNQVQLKIAEEEKNEEAVMLGLKMNMYLTKLRKELAKAAEVV
ncbi:MAG: toprim domain-containing protein [Bacteroidetes bacterium]|nr:toprim domain-containing protein [Bacteroidota bacterium]